MKKIKEKMREHLINARKFLSQAFALDLEKFPENMDVYNSLMQRFSSEVDKAESLFEVIN